MNFQPQHFGVTDNGNTQNIQEIMHRFCVWRRTIAGAFLAHTIPAMRCVHFPVHSNILAKAKPYRFTINDDIVASATYYVHINIYKYILEFGFCLRGVSRKWRYSIIN